MSLTMAVRVTMSSFATSLAYAVLAMSPGMETSAGPMRRSTTKTSISTFENPASTSNPRITSGSRNEKGPKDCFAISALTYLVRPSAMAIPQGGRELQMVNATIPSGTNTLCVSFRAASLSGKNWSPCWQKPISKLASGNGRAITSPWQGLRSKRPVRWLHLLRPSM